nr:MAG TPA: carbohydrate binding domain protein [Caudoviricetes sp.]
MGKTAEATMKLERKNGRSYAHIADINSEDINEIRYYFDGALYRSVMRCLEVKLKGDWTAKAKKGLLLDSLNLTVTHPESDSVTIGYGGFYIAEAPEYDAAQNITSIIAYDELYLSMQPYTESLWQSGITVKNYLIAILNKLGINYDTNSLNLMANADKKITSEKFLDIENDSTEAAYTYRDILDEIAKASGVTFAYKNSLGGDPFKLYAIKPTESGYVIDESNLRSVTIGAKYGPVMGVVLSREPQEDNIIYPSNLSDSQTAVKISNVEIMEDSGNDAYRETFIQGIYNNVKNTEYYLYDLDSFGIGFLNFGDIFTLKVCERKNGEIGEEKEYKTIFMRTDMTVGDGIKEKSKLEAPQATSTDYAAASTTDKALKKTMLKVDKQEQRITALVKESDERYSEFTQTAEGLEGTIANTKSGLEAKIEATAEKAELTYAKRETVDGQIKGITDQLEGIDGKIEGKVTTEVQQDTTISILAGKVESKISGNYVTKATYDDEKKNWLLKTTYDSYVKQTDQQISAAVSKVQKLENAGYITKAVCNSLIDQKSDSIALTVESNLKYESRNLLMESECFEHLTPTGYHATYQGDYVSTDATYLPSGKARKLTVKANDDSQIAGVSFSPSDTVGGVDKIKPNTTYTLSFWARLYPDDATQSLSSQASVYTATAPNNAIIDTKRTRGLALTKSWQKVVIVFTTQSTVSSFLLRFALAGCVNGQQYAIGISSLKLEIGNVATEWATRTPSAAEVEEYAKSEIAQLPDRITLSVEKNLKIGARNILLNSECFAGFTPTKYKVKTASMVPSRSDTYVPSGRYSSVVFTPEPTGGSTSRGIRFVETDILGQSTVDKVKPNTTYTLSFWLKTTDSAPVDELEKYSVIYAGEGASVSLDLNRSVTPTPTTSWQKYVLTFTITGTISKFYIMLFFKNCLASTQDSDIQYWIDISSFKLEEGNIATDWTPSTDDIDQSVKSVQAKIDMCVQKDENNNLVSEINIASNKLAINTDNFTLAKDGTMSCTGATITGGTILCGDTNTSMLIAQGAIVHKFDGTEIGQIGLTMNPDSSGNMQYYERISGTVGVQISANNYATFVDDAGFVVCSNARDTTINVSISSTTDWSYASYSSALRSIVEADSALIVSANRGNNNLYLEGSSIVTCGQLEALNDVKISGQLEALSGVKLRAAIGTSSSKSYVYVVADKKTGEIGFLSA